MTPTPRTDDTKVIAAAARLNSVVASMNEVLVDRLHEVNALRLCLVAREHLMLEGDTGVAKSKLVHAFHDRVSGFKLFSKQLTGTTMPDEVFGCMDSATYREKAIWKYNTSGMMPEADIAYLDEVYRGTGGLLSNMFSVMNERIFYNGQSQVKCPLNTVVGTTNFVTDSEELKAFHDRWLVTAHVAPLKTSQSRTRMLNLFLMGEGKTEQGFALDDLRTLQSAIKSQEIEGFFLELLDELVSKVSHQLNIRVSDRRLVQVLKLVMSSYVSDPDREENSVMNEGYIANAKFGVIRVGNEEQESVFAETFSKVVGEKLEARQMNKKLAKLAKKLETAVSSFDERMNAKSIEEFYVTAARARNAFTGFTSADMKGSNENMTLAENIMKNSELLFNSTQNILRKSIKKQVEKELAPEYEMEEEEEV